ncbi:MAG: MFS transporter [Deltaproteobacteria bacterium]|nr:MFS transporter [Deltaproteobacteria bacterium]
MTNNLSRIGDKLHVFRVLRYRDFRLYWLGHLTAVAGHQMVILAHGWLAWELTRSEYVLGALGLVAATPAVALTLFGGAAADKLELRRFLMLLQYITALLLLALATLVATGLVQVWHVFTVAAIHGGIQAFDHPARQALFPHLLDRAHLMNAVSLNSMIWPGTRIFGPALAGFTIDYVADYTGAPLSGAGAAYYVAAATYLMFGVLLFPVQVPVIERTRGGSFIRTLLGGLSFVWTQKLFRSLIGLNYLDIFFLASHTALLPVFADVVFSGDGTTLGNLYVVSGIGALLGALVAANLGYFPRRGGLILLGAGIHALFLTLFGLSGTLPLALGMLLMAGVGLSFFMVSTQTSVQTRVPDQYRGRVMAIWGMNYSVVLPMGQLQMGAVAGLSRDHLSPFLGRLAGAPSAVVLGGLVMLGAVGIMTVANRGVRELRPEGPA